MADDDGEGPWSAPGAASSPKPGRRRWSAAAVFVLAIAALSGLAALLFKAFPGRVSSGDDWASLAPLMLVLVVVAAGLATRRMAWDRAARYAAIWAGVVLALAVVVAYRPELTEAGLRVRSALVPSYGVASGARELTLTRDEDGSYYVVGRVNGRATTFLVDTGASDIVLSPADARRLGVDTAHLTYGGVYETANGEGRGARYEAALLEVGPIAFTDVPLSINQAPMRTSLLGMAFLRRLQSFRFEGDRLVMRAH